MRRKQGTKPASHPPCSLLSLPWAGVSVNHAEKETYVHTEPLPTLGFPLRLPVAQSDKRQDRGHVHHCKHIGVLGAYLTRRDQRPEDTGVISRLCRKEQDDG